jgi:hypothetical protein
MSLAANMRGSGADGCWGGVGHGPRIVLLNGNDAHEPGILLADRIKFVSVEIFCREPSHPRCRSTQMGKRIIKFENVQLQLEDEFQDRANPILHDAAFRFEFICSIHLIMTFQSMDLNISPIYARPQRKNPFRENYFQKNFLQALLKMVARDPGIGIPALVFDTGQP